MLMKSSGLLRLVITSGLLRIVNSVPNSSKDTMGQLAHAELLPMNSEGWQTRIGNLSESSGLLRSFN
jgi:hypothetical protein